MPDRRETGWHRGKSASDLISAQEIASFAYCPESWRLENGLGMEPGNRAGLAAGTLHHARKAVAERVAGGSLALGRLLVAVALLGLLLLWVLSR
jgi:hypothetical protein